MSKIFQADTLFKNSVSLKQLKLRVETALIAQQESLKLLNQKQNLCRIDELNWESATCFCFLLQPNVSIQLVKKTVKCLLIEHYGEQAAHVKIIVHTDSRSS